MRADRSLRMRGSRPRHASCSRTQRQRRAPLRRDDAPRVAVQREEFRAPAAIAVGESERASCVRVGQPRTSAVCVRGNGQAASRTVTGKRDARARLSGPRAAEGEAGANRHPAGMRRSPRSRCVLGEGSGERQRCGHAGSRRAPQRAARGALLCASSPLVSEARRLLAACIRNTGPKQQQRQRAACAARRSTAAWRSPGAAAVRQRSASQLASRASVRAAARDSSPRAASHFDPWQQQQQHLQPSTLHASLFLQINIPRVKCQTYHVGFCTEARDEMRARRGAFTPKPKSCPSRYQLRDARRYPWTKALRAPDDRSSRGFGLALAGRTCGSNTESSAAEAARSAEDSEGGEGSGGHAAVSSHACGTRSSRTTRIPQRPGLLVRRVRLIQRSTQPPKELLFRWARGGRLHSLHASLAARHSRCL
ncbi:unnamed protein product [Lampetra planeri]